MTKKCDLCNKTSDVDGDYPLYYGEWMTRSDVTVHYYCLLLSTHLPQNGEDVGGILGFYLRDIRKESKLAKARRCIYCHESSATIMCHKCKGYFHMTCGHKNMALYYFVGDFRSYCGKCAPHDYQRKDLLENPPDGQSEECHICTRPMGDCVGYRWIYSRCCNRGYVHNKCMRLYALQAGYYLKCIWCRDKKFREDVKYMGIFVPDRDANWEREKGAYQDLYRKKLKCEMDKCNCPKGATFVSAKWSISKCVLCGSFCAHNPWCIPGMEQRKEKVAEFKCETCSATERTLLSQSLLLQTAHNIDNDGELKDINTTLHVRKDTNDITQCDEHDVLEFSDDSVSSTETVINTNLQYSPTICSDLFSKQCQTKPASRPPIPLFNVGVVKPYVPTLTQSSNVSSFFSTSQPIRLVKRGKQQQYTAVLEDTVSQCVVSSTTVSSSEPTHSVQRKRYQTEAARPDPMLIKFYTRRLLDLFDP